ncbi:T9SS type A sorting domain-containing protein [Patiriisocius sp. Uisw_017]|uniref:DUF7619 domain-containing protein n=1 Tax=Patiriisocius sp. Uisw_017 TaxID=3230968 RepID=UPI0039EB09A3
MKQLLLLLTFTITASSFAQIVNIPDPEFKQRLLNNSNINTNGDGEIQVSEAEAFDGSILIGFPVSSTTNITDFTGIEFFTNVTKIAINRCIATSIDLSENNFLEEISITNGVMESIILPNTTTILKRIDFTFNYITDFTFLNNYTNLEEILLLFNPIVNLPDFENLELLENLSLSGLDLTTLDMSSNINLTELHIQSTSINNVNLLNNVNLVSLHVYQCPLVNIDLSNNLSLESLLIAYTEIEDLNISTNINLDVLAIVASPIAEIDFSNSDLESITLINSNDLSVFFTTLDLSLQSNLTYLGLVDVKINNLDLSQNINLRRLTIEKSSFQSLDLSALNLLESLNLRSIPINSFNLPDVQTNLKRFVLWDSAIEELDLSQFENICRVFIRYNNEIHTLNLKNGNTNALVDTLCVVDGGQWISGVAITYNPNLNFVCVDDANFAATNFTAASPYITFTEDCSLNSSDINKLTGDVTYDLDNNGCSSGDFGIENTLVSSSDGTNTFATNSIDTGDYTINLGENTYTTGVLGLPSYFEATPASAIDTFVGFNNTEQQDFCVQATTTANDLNISINPQFAPQPGEQGVYNVVYQNAGTTQLNATVTLTYDPDKVSFAAATPAISSQTTNTLTWNLGPINPFTTASIIVRLDLFSQPINMEGDDLILQAVIDPISGDATPDDNVFDLLDFVRNPEIIDNFTVVQGAQVLVTDADEFLNYVVPFTNTTQNVVNNVTIFTIFDADVDVSTLQIIDSSHPVSFSMANNEAFFELDNIGLPVGGSVLGQNRGYVMYRIKPRAGIVDGDVVSANVNLKLDGVFQQTNFVSTIYRDVLDTPINEISTIKLYPNPTNGLITIETNSSIKEVKVFNLAGQLLKTESNIQNAQTTLNIEAFPTGIYFANVKTERGEKVFKIVKK